jgi:hypothetical protein
LDEGEKKRKKKMIIGDKPTITHGYMSHHEEENTAALLRTRLKARFDHRVAMHAPSKKCGCHSRTGTY